MSNDLLHIVDIDHEGRGVAKKEEKTFFIHNALIDEKVEYKILKKKKNIFFGIATHIENPSPARADPSCPHYNVCGGCSMQHFKHSSQIEFKNNAFFQTLEHIGKVVPESQIQPIFLEFSEYRHKARLRAKYVDKKDKVLVGFNERLTHFLTDMDSCEVLPGRISSCLGEIKSLIKNLSIYNRMPQIEYASNGERDIFIFRILDPLSNDDIKKEYTSKNVEKSIFQRFFDRLYFSIITGCLLGYGDIYPLTNLCKFFVMLQSLLTIIIIVY